MDLPLFLFTVSLGQAGPPTADGQIDLSWRAPAGCPTELNVREAVDRHIRASGTAIRGTVRVDAQVRQSGETWQADLWIRAEGSEGTRRLTDASCQSLTDAAAFVIAVAAAPGSTTTSPISTTPEPPVPDGTPGGATVPEPATVPSKDPAVPRPADTSVSTVAPVMHADAARPETSTSPPLSPAAASRDAATLATASEEPAAPTRTDPALAVGLAGGMTMGHFPSPTGTLRGEIGIEWPRLLVFAGVRYWTPTEHFTPNPELEGTSNVVSHFQGVTAAVLGCPALIWGRVRVPVCAGLEAGVTLARATGTDVAPHPRTDPYAGAVAQLGLAMDVVPRIRVSLLADGSYAFTRTQFVVGGLGPVHGLGAWNGGVILGVAVPLP